MGNDAGLCLKNDQWLLRTHRGTRPGSPLADIIFHALMMFVTKEIDAWLECQDHFQMLLREIGIEVPTIVWADDIAIPLATNVAADLVPFLKAVLQQVRGVLRRQGFALNLGKSKCSLILQRARGE